MKNVRCNLFLCSEKTLECTVHTQYSVSFYSFSGINKKNEQTFNLNHIMFPVREKDIKLIIKLN